MINVLEERSLEQKSCPVHRFQCGMFDCVVVVHSGMHTINYSCELVLPDVINIDKLHFTPVRYVPYSILHLNHIVLDGIMI